MAPPSSVSNPSSPPPSFASLARPPETSAPGFSLSASPPFSSWAHLFKAASSSPQNPSSQAAAATLARIASSSKGKIVIDPSWVEDRRAQLRKGLIGKFLGRPPLRHAIERDIRLKWGFSSGVQVAELAGDFFHFKFDATTPESAHLDVLAGGPWSLGGRMVKLIPWRENFHALREEITSVPVWVRFDDLPPEYFDPRSLQSLASYFGVLLKLDTYTISSSKERFARMCIEIDLSKPLESGVHIESNGHIFFQPIAYENIPLNCFACGQLGHSLLACPKRRAPPSSSSEAPPPSSPSPFPALDEPTAEPSAAPSLSPLAHPPANLQSAGQDAPHELVSGPWIRVERRRRKPGPIFAGFPPSSATPLSEEIPRPSYSQRHKASQLNLSPSAQPNKFVFGSPSKFKGKKMAQSNSKLPRSAVSSAPPSSQSNKKRRASSFPQPQSSDPLILHHDPPSFANPLNPLLLQAERCITMAKPPCLDEVNNLGVAIGEMEEDPRMLAGSGRDSSGVHPDYTGSLGEPDSSMLGL